MLGWRQAPHINQMKQPQFALKIVDFIISSFPPYHVCEMLLSQWMHSAHMGDVQHLILKSH